MTNPPTYDKSQPDVTSQIRRGLSPGFVEYGPLYTEVPSWNTSRIIIIWDLSPRFVIYGEYPRFDKYHPYMTNPSTPRWVEKNTSSALDQWEASKLTMWPLFGQSQGSISLLKKVVRSPPYQKNRWGLSYMGGVCQIWVWSHIRDVFHDGTWVYRSPYLTNPTHIWQTPPHWTNPTHIWQTPLLLGG